MDQLPLQAGKKPALFIAVPNGKRKPQNSNEHSEETIQQIIYQLIKVDYRVQWREMQRLSHAKHRERNICCNSYNYLITTTVCR